MERSDMDRSVATCPKGATGGEHQKHDGRRLLVLRRGSRIIGINRRGLVVAIPEPIRQAVAALPCDVLIDGEAIGEALHAFDLLESGSGSLREMAYIDRHRILLSLLQGGEGDTGLPGLCPVPAPIEPADKLATFEALREAVAEGVVFKDIHAPYRPGRPASGGPQLKFKFVESASFVVTGHNPRRSIALGIYGGDGDNLIPAGNVTIPANHRIPASGKVCEVRYLYAYRESGSIYQPVYLGTRDDIPASECVVGQLKYKPGPQLATR